MLKNLANVQIKQGAKLVITQQDFGYCGYFLAELLELNWAFKNIGLYYSQYLKSVVGYLPEDNNYQGRLRINSDLFYNEDKNILLLNFVGLPTSDNLSKFLIEFEDKFIKSLGISEVVLAGGILNSKIDSQSILFDPLVQTYYISNSIDDKIAQSLKLSSLKAHVDEANPKNDKVFPEFSLLEGKTFAKKLIKSLDKLKVNVTFLFTFSKNNFDAVSTVCLFERLLNLLGLLSNIQEYKHLKTDDEYKEFFSTLVLKKSYYWVNYLLSDSKDAF